MKDRFSDQKILRHLNQDVIGEVDTVYGDIPGIDNLVNTPEGRGVLSGIVASVKGENIANPPDENQVRASRAALLDKINVHNSPIENPALSNKKLKINEWYVRGAGVLSVCVAVLMLVFVGKNTTVTNEGRLNSSVSTYTTGNKQQATIILPDSSRILLNVGSRIDVPTDYAAGNRTLTLQGEAFFTVTPNDRAPFIVKAGYSTTRVLGTSFSVRHYDIDSVSTIAVRDGRVVVGEQVLGAGQETYVSKRGIAPVKELDILRFAFVSGKLIIESQPLINAIPELNRWFGVDLKIGDADLRSRRIVGMFESGSVSDLISMLELTYDVRIVRDGNTLTMFSRE